MSEGAAHCKVQGHSAVTFAKTAEAIEMPLGLWARDCPRQHLFGGLHTAHWRYVVNISEPCTCIGDAACCKILCPIIQYPCTEIAVFLQVGIFTDFQEEKFNFTEFYPLLPR